MASGGDQPRVTRVARHLSVETPGRGIVLDVAGEALHEGETLTTLVREHAPR